MRVSGKRLSSTDFGESDFTFSWDTGNFQLVSDFLQREFVHELLLNWYVCEGKRGSWTSYSAILLMSLLQGGRCF